MAESENQSNLGVRHAIHRRVLSKLGIGGQPSAGREDMGRRTRCAFRPGAAFFAITPKAYRSIDMLVVASASFRLVYVMIILALQTTAGRSAYSGSRHPTEAGFSRQVTEAFKGKPPTYLLRESRRVVCGTSASG